VVTALISSIPFLAVIVAAVVAFLGVSPLVTLFISVFGLVTIIESAVVGLAVGGRFADYSEVPRARFVSPNGMMIGMVALAVVVGGTFFAPQLLDRLNLGPWAWGINAAAVAVIGVVVSVLVYRLALTEVKRAYDSAPV